MEIIQLEIHRTDKTFYTVVHMQTQQIPRGEIQDWIL